MRTSTKGLLLLFTVITVFCFFSGCQKTNEETSGTSAKEIIEFFPSICEKDIESCTWTCEKTSKESRSSVGPNTYAFYGNVEVSKGYYEEIISQYDWIESDEKTLNDYLDKISEENTVWICDEYENDFQNTNYVWVLLNKENRMLYFYLAS